MTAHTDGPWTWYAKLSGSENHRGYGIRGDRWELAMVQPGDEDGKVGEANARLIATAPQLVLALEEALEFIDDHVDVVDGPDGEQRPNRAMDLARELREVLGRATRSASHG